MNFDRKLFCPPVDKLIFCPLEIHRTNMLLQSAAEFSQFQNVLLTIIMFCRFVEAVWRQKKFFFSLTDAQYPKNVKVVLGRMIPLLNIRSMMYDT